MSLLQNVPFPFVPMMAKDIKKASSIMINNDYDIEIWFFGPLENI